MSTSGVKWSYTKHTSTSSCDTPARANSALPVTVDSVSGFSTFLTTRCEFHSPAPNAPPMMYAGGCLQSLARAAEVITTAAPPSVSRQQSNKWSGSAMMREF